MTSILIADDHGIVREGLRRLIEAEPDFSVCAEALDGQEVLEMVEQYEPEVVILDITMPKLGGLETLKRLRVRHRGIKVILLSVHSDPPFIQSAVSLGADGYVLKNGKVGEVVLASRPRNRRTIARPEPHTQRPLHTLVESRARGTPPHRRRPFGEGSGDAIEY